MTHGTSHGYTRTLRAHPYKHTRTHTEQAKTVRKKSTKTKGKTMKSAKQISKPAALDPPASSSAPVAAEKENAPVNKSVVLNSSGGAGGGGDDGAKRQLKKRTPFFIFCTDKRGEVRETHPDMAITEQVCLSLGVFV